MPSPAFTDKGGPCPYCTQALPAGRAVSFCPHCGMNVTTAQCPACSSEVEPDWHFCVTCGRDVRSARTVRVPGASAPGVVPVAVPVGAPVRAPVGALVGAPVG